jgi:hypothetical protein
MQHRNAASQRSIATQSDFVGGNSARFFTLALWQLFRFAIPIEADIL